MTEQKIRVKPKSKIEKLFDEMHIDETYTKAPPKYKFDTIKQNKKPCRFLEYFS